MDRLLAAHAKAERQAALLESLAQPRETRRRDKVPLRRPRGLEGAHDGNSSSGGSRLATHSDEFPSHPHNHHHHHHHHHHPNQVEVAHAYAHEQLEKMHSDQLRTLLKRDELKAKMEERMRRQRDVARQQLFAAMRRQAISTLANQQTAIIISRAVRRCTTLLIIERARFLSQEEKEMKAKQTIKHYWRNYRRLCFSFHLIEEIYRIRRERKAEDEAIELADRLALGRRMAEESAYFIEMKAKAEREKEAQDAAAAIAAEKAEKHTAALLSPKRPAVPKPSASSPSKRSRSKARSKTKSRSRSRSRSKSGKKGKKKKGKKKKVEYYTTYVPALQTPAGPDRVTVSQALLKKYINRDVNRLRDSKGLPLLPQKQRLEWSEKLKEIAARRAEKYTNQQPTSLAEIKQRGDDDDEEKERPYDDSWGALTQGSWGRALHARVAECGLYTAKMYPPREVDSDEDSRLVPESLTTPSLRAPAGSALPLQSTRADWENVAMCYGEARRVLLDEGGDERGRKAKRVDEDNLELQWFSAREKLLEKNTKKVKIKRKKVNSKGGSRSTSRSKSRSPSRSRKGNRSGNRRSSRSASRSPSKGDKEKTRPKQTSDKDFFDKVAAEDKPETTEEAQGLSVDVANPPTDEAVTLFYTPDDNDDDDDDDDDDIEPMLPDPIELWVSSIILAAYESVSARLTKDAAERERRAVAEWASHSPFDEDNCKPISTETEAGPAIGTFGGFNSATGKHYTAAPPKPLQTQTANDLLANLALEAQESAREMALARFPTTGTGVTVALDERWRSVVEEVFSKSIKRHAASASSASTPSSASSPGPRVNRHQRKLVEFSFAQGQKDSREAMTIASPSVGGWAVSVREATPATSHTCPLLTI